MRIAAIVFLILITTNLVAQRGKDGSGTVSGAGTIVNEYTTLTADATAGVTAIFVGSNNLNTNGRFAAPLAAGDLVLIYQAQGASINGVLHPTFLDVCSPNNITWGSINSLDEAGNYEFVEVTGTIGGSIINLRCGLANSYTAAGNVQVVRVQRYTDLTVTGAGTLTAEDWAGSTGGIVAVEVEGNTIVNGTIDVSDLGFRGGVAAGSSTTTEYNTGWHAGTTSDKGGAKGEGVVGDWADYDLVGGRFAKGAIGNGAGGGNAHNAGGGGGGNASSGTYTWSGVGIPDFVTGSYATAWALEGLTPGSESSGGGRGGYAWSTNSNNPLTTAPGNAAWGGHNRANIGGYGGRDLDYSTGKIFFGGGGGGGHENDNQGGEGGDGGGIVFVYSYGTISGSGTIQANGEDGQGSDYTNAGFGQITNKDGSGGAGAGGAIILSSPLSITLNNMFADGGDGGNQVLDFGPFASGDEAEGPGGGGSGGYLSTTGTTGTTTVTGGRFGTSNASHLSAFDPNGATSGDAGLIETNPYTGSSLTVPNDTICTGNTGTLTATGSPETGSTITWYDGTWNQVGTGSSYTTPVLAADAMYFYGSCPGTDYDTVWVIVGTGVVIDDSGVSVTDETCAGNDGSITGITVSGGTLPYVYTWNAGPSSGLDTLNAGAGSYTLVITDAAGCTDNSGAHVIGTGSGVSLDVTGLTITPESCAGGDGSITGITVSGGTSPYIYAWNGGPSSGADTTLTSAGTYTLIVTDQSGCTATTGPLVIGSAAGLSLDVTALVITDANCTATDGSITGIVASGGSLPYSFQWNGSTSSSEDSTGLAAGSYTLLVTDGGGCTISSGPHVVNSVNTLIVDSVGFVLTDENCTGVDGSISGITVSGGAMPYVYAWNGNNASGPDTSGLGAGTYTLVVSDANGCIDSTGVYTINSVNNMVIDSTSFVLTDANCASSDGTITGITVSGPGSSYTYDWNGTGFLSADLTGAAPGTYTLVITDNNGCVDSTGTYTINSVNTMVIDSTGFAVTDANCTSVDGAISGITVSGGSLPYVYSWNGNNASGPDTSGLAPGTYTLVISDNNGCIDSTGVYTINSVNNMVIDSTAFVITDANCGATDGSVSGITVSGPGTSYTYTWNSTASGTIDLTGVAAGNYMLVVTDDNGCVDSTGLYNVGSISTLAIDTSGITIANENCGASDGSITGILVTGGTLPYSFDWSGVATSGADTTGVIAGAYVLTVTDAAGCIEIMGPVTVGSNSTLSIDASLVALTDENCGLADASITGITATGAGTLTYQWNGVTTSGADTVGLGAGAYTLVVTDGNGCVDSVGVYTITNLAGPAIDTSAMVIVDDACGQGIGSISGIVTTGGTGAIDVQWDAVTASFDTSGLFAGAYTISIMDAIGCTDTIGPVLVIDLGNPTADFGASPMVTDVNNPLVTFTDASSLDVTSWSWTFDTLGTSTAMDTTFNFTEVGSYDVTLAVMNALGCVDTVTYTIVVNDVDSLSIPNIITPDGNGQNDIFVISGLPSGSYVAIYNRWGQKLFETKNYLNNWDARTSAGDKVVNGTYYYVIQDPSGNEYTGPLTVVGE